MTYIDKIQQGFFYNCPNEGCIKELYYNKLEDTYCIAIYLYAKIIDVHNTSITNEEFCSRLKMYPDKTMEFQNGTETFTRIHAMLDANAIMPDFIGMIRHNLYSIATANLYDKQCVDCLHFGQCEAVKMHDPSIPESCNAKDCGFFLDKNVAYSMKTFQTLRVYFVNEISKFSNFDDFVAYCKMCDINRDLLRSLNIHYIVFINNKNTLYCNGHAQVYESKEKAKEYVESIVRIKREEAIHFGKPDSFSVQENYSTIITNYETTLGSNKSYIQFVSI